MFSLNLLVKNRIKNGRLFIYEKDTTDLADVYTYEGSEYVEGPNPIYCVDGIPSNTYFLKDRIYDVLAQEYVGESSDPSGDLREGSWVESFTTKIGFDIDEAESSESIETVFTIDGLKQAPTGGYVRVIGYWNNSDCEERLYKWDSNAVNTEDGGLIISSNVTDTGRWLLICNEIMKSEYYGVYGNKQDNLANLFAYNDTYGSIGLVSPKTIYLAPGSYGDGYSAYNARGKKVVFGFGASIRQGNTLRALSVEGINPTGGVLGNIQIGFNSNGQWDEARAKQPVRLSTYNTLDEFLNSWSKYLIFDKEGDITLGATKTLQGCYCVFEKPIRVISQTNSTIYFDGCTIVSDHKILDGYAIDFKNMFVSDKWFSSIGAFDPDPNSDINCSARSTDFDYAANYWKMLNLYSPSAVTANFAGMETGTLNLSDTSANKVTIQNYAGPSLTISSPELKLLNCTANAIYSYANDLTVENCDFGSGYLLANADGAAIKRYFKDNKFGKTISFTMENATACDISAYNNDFGSNRSMFISNNGLDVGNRAHTDYRNNAGLGDNFNFKYTANYASTAIVNGNTLVWNDSVGLDDWNNGYITYKITPGKTEYWDYVMNNITNVPGISYSADYVRNGEGRVTDFTQIKISATFSNNAWLIGPGDAGLEHTIIRLGR